MDIYTDIVVLTLDGSSVSDAHLQNGNVKLTCPRHMIYIDSTISVSFRKDLFYTTFMSYNLI